MATMTRPQRRARLRGGVAFGFLLWLALIGATPHAEEAPAIAPAPIHVDTFSPESRAKQIRQISVRFTAGVVAMGDPRLPDPFAIDCRGAEDLPKGRGRWADDRNWEYDFDADLPAGVRCSLTLKPGLVAATGVALVEPRRFEFDSGGPAIVQALPYDGHHNIDENQLFVLKTDALVDSASVEKHARCLVDGVSEQMPVTVLSGKARADAIEQAKRLGFAVYDILWKDGRQSRAAVRDTQMETKTERIVVLRCQRRLPAFTTVRLRWGTGIASRSGVATERDQDLVYQTRPNFTADMSCTRSAARAGCLPMTPVTLTFSAPVPRAQALAATLTVGDAAPFVAKTTEAAQVAMLSSVSFEAPFPADRDASITLPTDLRDDAGRPLANAARYPLKFHIDPEPPLAKFPGLFGLLEARQGGVLPVSVRNLDPNKDGSAATLPVRIRRVDDRTEAPGPWLERVEKSQRLNYDWRQRTADGHARNITGAESVFTDGEVNQSVVLPAPLGKQPAELIGIPLGKPGLYIVEVSSRVLGRNLLGDDRRRYVSTAALVTDLAVHFKWGRESSLVWVTRLSDGSVVADAEVAVSGFCGGPALWVGRTDRDGIARIGSELGPPDSGSSCSYSHPLLASARKDGDYSFTASFWHNGIQSWDFGMPVGNRWQAEAYVSVLDRGLYHPGETVAMKHVIRHRSGQGFDLDIKTGSQKIEIRHLGSDQVFALDVAIDAGGLGETRFTLPPEAKLGEYAVRFPDITPGGIETARFRVEQFRLPSMRAVLTGPRTAQVNPKEVAVDAHVTYLSGGSAGGLRVKLRSTIEPAARSFPDFADYRFDGARPKPGIARSDLVEDLDAFEDGDAGGASTEEVGGASVAATKKVRVQQATLDGNGMATIRVDGLPSLTGPGYLATELEYADANGEILTTGYRVRLTPAALAVGIRTDGWASAPEQLKFRVVVLDTEGKPAPDHAVNVQLFRQERYSYRKRMIGGFYSYETLTETKALPATCQGRSNAQGFVFCDLAPGGSGEILIWAETRDAAGNRAGALAGTWIRGGDDWYGGSNSDRMDLIPEKTSYEAGESAKLQVRMPFRAATALVTTEREGVLEAFVRKIDARSPLVELPITGAHSPNVMVSVLAVRGRVAHVEQRPKGVDETGEITALVDLNKPAYRMGMTQLKVGWTPHRLDVSVQPTAQEFKVREHATVKVQVKRADGGALPEGTEVAIAAVDEALLLLKNNETWDLLGRMMGERGNEVQTATASMQVIGKRHYGRKAVAPGGGGGREVGRARERFDSLLSWTARVKLDAHGDATVEIPLNDSLSAFRIVAIASAGAQHFGSGSATIRTVQDLILVNGLPPLVREGDHFAATVTIRNTSPQTLKTTVRASVGGKPLPARTLDLAPSSATDVTWPVEVPYTVSTLDWDLSAEATGASDRMKLVQKVIAAVPVRTYQATIAQLDQPLSIEMQRPEGAIPGRGGLEVRLTDHLGGSLDGVREYMQLYPYVCLEQNLSRAIVLDDDAGWNAWMERLPAYMDRDGLLRYFPSEQLDGEDSLTAYVLTIAAEKGWEIPEARRKVLIAALKGFVGGRVVRYSALPTADLAIRKLAAIDALAHYDAAEPAMLDSLALDPKLLPASALLDLIDLTRRLPSLKNAEALHRQALAQLRARLNFQGTIMTLSGEQNDALWWLMISADSNSNRLLLAVLDEADWRPDVPRLVRGALARQQRGHWNTTVANAWGVVALEKFAAAFESTPVTGTTRVTYGKQKTDIAWPLADDDINTAEPVKLPWNEGQSTFTAGQEGTGAPWLMVRTTAALPLKAPLSTGLRITRRVEAIERKSPDHWTRGDVLRIHLDLSAQADATWVVIDDPIPAGASIQGSGLGGSSALLAAGQRASGYGWLAYEERRFDAYRAYYRFVPKGDWSIEYTVRLNNPGEFQLPASRIEAMYAPEMFGETPNPVMTVEAVQP